jgi:radical SAM superfamily enzyme YgiQ (UPF0313 family)
LKVALVYPPQGEPSYPPLGIPSLTAFLRREGVAELTVHDLNIDSYDYFLSRDVLGDSARQAEWRLSRLERGRRLRADQFAEYRMVSREVLSAEYVQEHIEEAKAALRGMGAEIDLPRYQWALRVIRAGLRLLSAAVFPTELRLNSYQMRYSPESWRAVKRAIADRRENLYLSYYQNRALPRLLAEEPDLVGISVNWSWQVIPALTLARLLKARAPEVHICMGGNWVSHLWQEIARLPELFTLFDSAVRFDGETALVALCRALAEDRSLEDVPNLTYRRGREVATSEATHLEDVAALPTPDFTGFPLDRYFSPEPVLPLATSRGCYWGKCAYCSHHYAYQRYRKRPAEQVAGDMNGLHERHGVRNFFFMDDCPSPAVLRALSRQLLDEGRAYRWGGEVRFERAFTPELCRLMSEAGCRIVLFGMESASQRVLDLMRKGVQREVMIEVIDNCHRAGINVWVLFFLGFPGETAAEARETLAFLAEHKEKIVSATGGTFVLLRHCAVQEELDSFELSARPLPGDKDLALALPHERHGLPDRALQEMIDRFMDGEGREFRGIAPVEAHGLFLTHEQFKQGYLTERERARFVELAEGWADRPVRLNRDTYVRVLRFDLRNLPDKARQVEARPVCWIYEGSLDQISQANPATEQLLGLADGTRTPRRIAAELAPGNTREQLEILGAIRDLLRYRYLILD